MKLENRLFDEIKIGDRAGQRRLITENDLFIFAAASGNHNPLHRPDLDGDGDGRPEGVAPGMFFGALIAGILGTTLPGPGTLFRSVTLNFDGIAEPGEEVLISIEVTAKRDGIVTFATEVRRASDNVRIVHGQAEVLAPRHKYRADNGDIPGLIVQRHRHFDALLERARPLPAIRTAVVCPEEVNSLGGAVLAAQESLIIPILIGDEARIRTTAEAEGFDISTYELIHIDGHEKAAAHACELVHQGRAEAVMKGNLHTDDLLRPMVDREKGLRMGRRFTHVFVMDVPGLPAPLMVTDAAINIAPDLKTKVDIVQNAIELAISLGQEVPRVGVLSAVETVNPDIQSSIDAALLSKMAERGQIKGGLVDGPLAMDNAVDLAAARTKGIRSEVAGRAEILVVPGIDAGNMLAKQLTYISHAEAAGLVLGARVPVILNSRADSSKSRLASCAVAALHHARLNGIKAEASA